MMAMSDFRELARWQRQYYSEGLVSTALRERIFDIERKYEALNKHLADQESTIGNLLSENEKLKAENANLKAENEGLTVKNRQAMDGLDAFIANTGPHEEGPILTTDIENLFRGLGAEMQRRIIDILNAAHEEELG